MHSILPRLFGYSICSRIWSVESVVINSSSIWVFIFRFWRLTKPSTWKKTSFFFLMPLFMIDLLWQYALGDEMLIIFHRLRMCACTNGSFLFFCFFFFFNFFPNVGPWRIYSEVSNIFFLRYRVGTKLFQLANWSLWLPRQVNYLKTSEWNKKRGTLS